MKNACCCFVRSLPFQWHLQRVQFLAFFLFFCFTAIITTAFAAAGWWFWKKTTFFTVPVAFTCENQAWCEHTVRPDGTLHTQGVWVVRPKVVFLRMRRWSLAVSICHLSVSICFRRSDIRPYLFYYWTFKYNVHTVYAYSLPTFHF